MMNKAFSKEEIARLVKAPNVLEDFFKRANELGWTVAAEQIRSTYWEIETHATRLRRMAKGWQTGPTAQDVITSKSAQDVLNSAADELDRLNKMCVRRPISELRQEAFGKGHKSGPDRLIVGWFMGGPEQHRFWIARIMRLTYPPTNPAGCWVDEHGFHMSDIPTHFSEMPTDDPSVL